eukprot:GHVO01067338.1.p1 GENE.GHVO01067338.1~~GHVO01067338.1.p1  ORF type:complete len:239 (+),score=33.08 GHVO01067338.1:59-718(+)
MVHFIILQLLKNYKKESTIGLHPGDEINSDAKSDMLRRELPTLSAGSKSISAEFFTSYNDVVKSVMFIDNECQTNSQYYKGKVTQHEAHDPSPWIRSPSLPTSPIGHWGGDLRILAPCMIENKTTLPPPMERLKEFSRQSKLISENISTRIIGLRNSCMDMIAFFAHETGKKSTDEQIILLAVEIVTSVEVWISTLECAWSDLLRKTTKHKYTLLESSI